MATTDESPTRKPWPRRDGVLRFTITPYYQLDELGFFHDRHVELIEGAIHESTVRPAPWTASALTREVLSRAFENGSRVREAKPLDVGR